MSETLTFKDGTVIPIIALHKDTVYNFQGQNRNMAIARIALSGTTLAALEAFAFDAAKTVSFTHTYDQVSTTTGTDGKQTTKTVQKTQEYNNYVIPHHISREYETGDTAYEYFLALCQKTETEAENETMKAQLASSLEG